MLNKKHIILLFFVVIGCTPKLVKQGINHFDKGEYDEALKCFYGLLQEKKEVMKGEVSEQNMKVKLKNATVPEGKIVLIARYKDKNISEAQGFVGEVFNDTSCGVLCYVDVSKNKIYDVIFDEDYNPFVELEDERIKYLDAPYQGEQIVFLTNNRKVGEGVVNSIGGGFSEYQGIVYCKVTKGRIGSITMSKSLFNVCKRETEFIYKDSIENSSIRKAVIEKLRNKGINVSYLEDFQIIKKLPALIHPGKVMWLVTINAGIRIPEELQKLPDEMYTDESGDYYLNNEGEKVYTSPEAIREDIKNLEYMINVIIVEKNKKPTIDFIVAYPSITALTFDELRDYCEKHNISFIDINGKVEEYSYYHFGPFVDWIDIDGDGTSEVILEYWGYEGGGSLVLKRIENKWRAMGGYYLGV